MPDWPVTLPDIMLIGMTDQRQGGKIRSNVDVGPAIVRRRYTAAVRNVDIPITLSNDERVIFDDFYINDLEEGALSFLWRDPVTDATTSFRFREENGPAFQAVVGSDDSSTQRWDATLQLEILPS